MPLPEKRTRQQYAMLDALHDGGEINLLPGVNYLKRWFSMNDQDATDVFGNWAKYRAKMIKEKLVEEKDRVREPHDSYLRGEL